MPSSLLKFVKQYSVKIGGRKYKAVKIGNQLWMAENLDWRFDVNGSPIPISSESSSTPVMCYYSNNQSTYGIDGTYKCGALYNRYAATYLSNNINTLVPGWRLPSDTDFETLKTFVGTGSATQLKAKNNTVTSNWPNWDGTDTFGFNGLPTGYKGGGFVGFNTKCPYWTSIVTNWGDGESYWLETGQAELYSYTASPGNCYNIRLVKTLA